MQKTYVLLFSLFAAFGLQAQDTYRYAVNLNEAGNDQLRVSLQTPAINKESIAFNFPATIPGTYATEDYGRFISDFQAKDEKGNLLTVSKQGNNTFLISNAKNLKSISYKVDDSFDAKVKKDKIFEPAGTNIEAGKNFVFNNSGFFGYFEGMELIPFELEFTKPAELYGATAMPQLSIAPTTQKMRAQDYHQLVDCPILFAKPDTVSFYVNTTKVLLAVYDQSGKPNMANEIYDEMKTSMEAIAKFLPALPVKNYAFLIYVGDYRAAGKALRGEGTLAEKAAAIKSLIGQGFGALEHGNSSFYYMPEFGIEGAEVKKMMKDVAIHEFMHIITPLGLHSQHIGNFNYVKPIMSKHLWLYEGITEYFAGLIQVQADLITVDSYLNSVLKSKIKAGEKFPATKMSMTEMSANVLDKKYHRHYNHVYDRGAVLGMLLDVEIIRLTNGEKTLKDVVLTLRNRYGSNKSFDEAGFIKEFVAEVHPDLQQFFDKYIEGKNEWNLQRGFETVGITYEKSREVSLPKDPASKKDNDIKLTASMIQIGGEGSEKEIAKVGKKEWAGLMAGDKVKASTAYKQAFIDPAGNYLPEGTKTDYPVIRKGEEIKLPLTVSYGKQTKTPFIQDNPQKNAQQQRFYQLWLRK